MALWSDKKEFIFKAVEEMYTVVASRPGAVFHFPTGRLACLFVGYPADQLDGLPAEATESFAGVGYPFAAAVIRAAGLSVEVFGELDYFAGSVNASTRRAAHGLGAHAIVMRGSKSE